MELIMQNNTNTNYIAEVSLSRVNEPEQEETDQKVMTLFPALTQKHPTIHTSHPKIVTKITSEVNNITLIFPIESILCNLSDQQQSKNESSSKRTKQMKRPFAKKTQNLFNKKGFYVKLGQVSPLNSYFCNQPFQLLTL
ncbi:Hypothetical_protein [Hexamita inflata]|uniref:Hypothetical_protein n=1 Tax=Hexamita inflata TaxID=28002 RepID=A0AA86TC30_9EUKA|nr:Hypothetical protein HINF_LOCUS1306 [Hexamita inflata]CAI9975119.1 Hypothetical protein HINF_LOCUS62764 [Hexamita inflata]